MDIYILAMRIQNNLWAENDIVDVFPITQAPEPGPYGQIKHAAIIVRNIPVTDTPGSFVRIKNLLTRQNLADDDVPEDSPDKRRWFINRAELSPQKRAAITSRGYVDIDWSELSVWKKAHGIQLSRRVNIMDLTSGA